jgi:hypothetical protein
MGRRSGLRAWRRFAKVAFALYAVFLVTAQFEHHDLACHLKTPLHCTSCNASPLSSTPRAPVAMHTHRLVEAGRAETFQILSEGALLSTARSGRAPPSLS